jgi:hypothetical protein
MSQYVLPSRSGMTPAKRLRALAPAILLLLAFGVYFAIVNGFRSFAVIKKPDAQFPMTGIFWGLDRIESTGTPIPFYYDATRQSPPLQGIPPLLAKPEQQPAVTPNIDQYIENWRSSQPNPHR